MIDGGPKLTGDSRLIKSNASLPETYAAFRELFISSGIPIDLFLNPAGWEILGTLLNKANLLTDETAAALGGVKTVNEALGALHETDAQNHASITQMQLEEIPLSSWNAFIRNGADLDVLAAIGKI